MQASRLVLAFITMSVVACSGSEYKVVGMPSREADLYPLSRSYDDVSVAVDEISESGRSARYFGVDLTRNGILPVDILISNFGNSRWEVRPADLLLRRGNQVIDPVPLITVTEMIKRKSSYNTETEKQIDAHFDSLVLKSTVVYPGEHYQGVLFFPVRQVRRRSDSFFKIPLFLEGLKLNVVATNLDTGERKQFGPYRISGGDKGW